MPLRVKALSPNALQPCVLLGLDHGTVGIEVVKRGAARYDFSDPYHIAIEMSWKEFALAFLGLELGINIVFALLYLASPGCIANARLEQAVAPRRDVRAVLNVVR